MPVQDYCSAQGLPLDDAIKDGIFHRARDAAREIIGRKGATYYAIAAGLLRVAEAILRDQNTVLAVSSPLQGYEGISDVCLSLPTVVSREGIRASTSLHLAPQEATGCATPPRS
jgi:L-lactate dehydrogenase